MSLFTCMNTSLNWVLYTFAFDLLSDSCWLSMIIDGMHILNMFYVFDVISEYVMLVATTSRYVEPHKYGHTWDWAKVIFGDQS